MFGPLSDVQMSYCVAGAGYCAPCQKWAKLEGFVAASTVHYARLHDTARHYTTHYITATGYNYTTAHELHALHDTTPHSTPLYYTPLHYIPLHYSTLHYAARRYITQHYTTLQYTTVHDTNYNSNFNANCWDMLYMPQGCLEHYGTWLELKWVKLSRRKCSNSFRVRVVRSGSNVVKHSVAHHVPKYSRCVNNLWDAWDVKGLKSKVEGSRPQSGNSKVYAESDSPRGDGAKEAAEQEERTVREVQKVRHLGHQDISANAEGQGAVGEVAGAGREGGLGHRRWTGASRQGRMRRRDSIQVEASAAGSSVKKKAGKTRQSRPSKRLAHAQWAATA